MHNEVKPSNCYHGRFSTRIAFKHSLLYYFLLIIGSQIQNFLDWFDLETLTRISIRVFFKLVKMLKLRVLIRLPKVIQLKIVSN